MNSSNRKMIFLIVGGWKFNKDWRKLWKHLKSFKLSGKFKLVFKKIKIRLKRPFQSKAFLTTAQLLRKLSTVSVDVSQTKKPRNNDDKQTKKKEK